MKLSYRTPRTMYTATSAASTSSGSLDRELVKDAAVPWKLAASPGGMCRSSWTLLTALMAAPNEDFAAMSKETVITGNWPWCEIVGRAVGVGVGWVVLKETALAQVEL